MLGSLPVGFHVLGFAWKPVLQKSTQKLFVN